MGARRGGRPGGECDPLQVILFGSVARGDDGPDSDLDLLVVLPKVEQSERHELMGRLPVRSRR
ncbi:MAG TPA: nucleotidyltransferase domain-containing protein [Acidimicrobiales bacterium]|nr:nucleotidyltransferase domain-containing protein [Acidimicrobiales bacterium]